MPSRAEHLKLAAGSKAHAERLLAMWPDDDDALRWAVTACFYSAVHYIEAYLAIYDRHPRRHEERAWLMQSAPDEMFTAYRRLYDASRQARYAGRSFTARYVRDFFFARLLPIVAELEGY